MRSIKHTLWTWPLMGAIAVSAAATVGCTPVETTDPKPGEQDTTFVSDAPYDVQGGTNTSTNTTTTSTSTGESGDPEKAIIEADIIQVDGDRLYALSQYSGLSIVDIADPADLKMLGTYRMEGTPFEMYLQGDVVMAMFSSWGHWECGPEYGPCDYITTSHVEALDVSDPASIGQIGTFDLPGEIADSRIVGDVLYAVSYEDGYCWSCENEPVTAVTSINVGDPANIAVVDGVSFANADDDWGYGWWRRSVTVTQDRMFIAGVEWTGQGDGGSTIQIVDISDPNGFLHLGGTVQAKGQIESRWQMDEKDGVLRVISQPGIWSEAGAPQVQTFQIENSDSIVPLATMDLTLPRPERLRSARFDGTRLYAITAEQTDPLFTIDLTSPAQPVQVGALEIPGWIYHLEPRGDRLFALGFDSSNAEGSMNVSLFDVADFANPALLERVAFGGDVTSPPEDQGGIHKAFEIDPALGVIFVPFWAFTYGDDYGCSKASSGVQIIDFTQDTLIKRGTAPAHGFARRAFVHEGDLFTVSDSEVAAYDIADRDAPAPLDAIAISTWVDTSVRAGDKIVRVSSDWWEARSVLDVVPASDPGRAEPLGMLDFSALVNGGSECYAWGYFYGVRLFPMDSTHVALVWSRWYEAGDPGSGLHVVVVNVSNAAEPFVQGSLSLPLSLEIDGWYNGLDGGEHVVQMGNRLVFRRFQDTYEYGDPDDAWLEVVDLSDFSNPQHTATIAMPAGYGHSRILKRGNQVLMSRWEEVPNQPGKVMFFMDRTVFPAAGAPTLMLPVNLPGSLLSIDPQSGHALTVDYHLASVPIADSLSCNQEHGYGAWFDDSSGAPTCHYMEHHLKLVAIDADGDVDVLDSELLPQKVQLYSVRVTDTRVFLQGYEYNYMAGDGDHYAVLAAGSIADDTLEVGRYDSPSDAWLYPMAAVDDKLVLTDYSAPGIYVLDAADLDAITLEKKGDITWFVDDVTLDGDAALVSMGPHGLMSVDLN